MKRQISLILFFLGLIKVVCGTGVQHSTLDTLNERVILFTDRNMYIAGEKILFSAMVSGDEIMSRILYCEIITPAGNKITGGKYLILNSGSSGDLTIPQDVVSGNYYFRSYTRFMRNEGPAVYNYILIKIVNPVRNEIHINSTGISISDGILYPLNGINDTNSLSISTDRPQYKSRDTIQISIGSTSYSSYQALNVAVVPELSSYNNDIKLHVKESTDVKSLYAPERAGISITGTVRDEINGNVLSGIRVNLSIIGAGRDFMAIRTNSGGRFSFSLPEYEGNRDLFLCIDRSDSLNTGILVENDFCSIPVQLQAQNFELSPEERETVLKMAVNYQLELSFDIDSATDEIKDEEPEYQAFYGKPDEVISMDNYVRLPTLEEYLNELPTLVKVRKRSGEKYFKILGPQTELIEFDPLVMVDLVAIDDPEGILVVNPANISRIEVVNAIYAKGDQTYGGIVNFISRKRDFAGINLPSSGIFINYGFLTPGTSALKYSKLPNIPDTRNTIFWEPKLELDKKDSTALKFTAPDTPGKYVIILKGINSAGIPVRQTKNLEIVKR